MESDDTIDRPTCFVISPIGSKGSAVRDDANTVLKHLIRKSLEPDFKVTRGDEDTNPGSITSRIVASILEADLIVADLSGHNANVFYEVAIAHGYRKPIVHIEQEGERPAFDLQDMRLVTYDTTKPDSLDEARAALSKYAHAAISKPNEAITPLSHSQQFLAYSKSENPLENSMADLLGEVRELRSEIRGSGHPSDAKGSIDADRLRLASIINRLADRDGLQLSDFQGVIDYRTTPRFDRWVEKVARNAAGGELGTSIGTTIYSPDMFGAVAEEDSA